MIRKALLAATALLAVAAPLAVTGTAHADPGSPGCVTRAEWSKIHKGAPRATVDRVFGTHGRILGVYGSGVINRQYTTCRSSGMSFAGITYVDNRVHYKLAS